jgi:hypothetical protein
MMAEKRVLLQSDSSNGLVANGDANIKARMYSLHPEKKETCQSN